MLLVPGNMSAEELYWEEPNTLVTANARFPETAVGGGKAAILWHEFGRSNGEIESISISIAVKIGEEGEWKTYEQVIGPFPYTGEEVPLASLEMTDNGEIFVAAAVTGQKIEVYSFEEEAGTAGTGETDSGADEETVQGSFVQVGSAGRRGGAEISVAPRLYEMDDGGLILFVTKPFSTSTSAEGQGSSLGITYSLSDNGREWTTFDPLVEDSDLSYIYLPSHESSGGREYVVFQASPPESRFFQIYMVESGDGGRSWSEPERLTDFRESEINQDDDPNNYDNQRPHLRARDGTFHLAWERRYAGNTPPQIYYLGLDREGEIKNDPERITTGTNNCRNPKTVEVNGNLYVLWFDDRKGDNRIFIAYREGIAWQDQDVSIMSGSSTFAQTLPFLGNLHLIWENTFRDRTRLVKLDPDRSVTPPSITPLNFPSGGKARQDVFRIRWNLPQDSSGIAGFNYSVDRDPEGSPPRTMQILRQQERVARAEVEQDGQWYFHVIARDYAGNWSKPSTVEFQRDTTPPPSIEFAEHETNERGFFPSNTATIGWEPPEKEEISGYTYRLQYLAGQNYEGSLDAFTIKEPPQRIRVQENSFSFYNMDNGLWALTVSPVDTVGNIGPSETYYFRLNNYIPVTYITRINMEQDQLNRYHMKIYGRGFSVGGSITEVMLDEDGEEPYDFVFPAEAGTFDVQSDRYIEGPTIQDISEGSYRVGLIHPERGVYFTGYRLSFESTGTVKFGDFRLISGEKEKLVRTDTLLLSMGDIAFFTVILLLVVLLVFTVYKLSSVAKEGYDLQMEVKALVHNTALPSEKKRERLKTMKKQRGGLRIKFALLVTFLVLIIVILVSLPLGRYMIQTQQRNLTRGLQESTQVLIESINTGAQQLLPEENTIELGRLPQQVEAAEDAEFVTITGPPASDAQVEDTGTYDYLWASNNPDIDEKILREEGYEESSEGEILFERGAVRIEDKISELIPDLRQQINREAREEVGALSDRLSALQQQAQEAAQELVRTDSQETAQLLRELQDEITRLSRQIEDELAKIGDVIGRVPEFSASEVLTGPTEYIFYKPIVYQDSSKEGEYYHGLVRLGISTTRIRAEIIDSRDTLIKQTALVALGAVFIGIIGAIILANIIIIPIRKLVSGVEKIRDTDDMSKFEERIQVKSRDEISILADTINDMTDGLVKAEAARKDLIFGKETQKRFIPLEQKGEVQLTTGKKTTEHIDLFGYYEGAKGVSGDYFDYIEYAEDRYAIIKCDVAGKGVPASLIMVEVATVFHNFLNDFMESESKKEDPDISKLIYSINRLVQARGFKGRFAALVVALVNAKTGATVFSNAGDTIVHIYNKEKRRMELKRLQGAPAAGVMDNDTIEMGGGFVKEPHMLKRGDAILFYTDGIEEAQRHFRDENFQITTCKEELGENELHGGTHNPGQNFEEFTNDRIYEIANAVFSRGRYRLTKYHNPLGDEELEFDFSSCEGTIEDAIIALISVEKIYRIYPDPSAGERDLIEVDTVINDFLREHFLLYESYFENEVPTEEGSQYKVFSHLREDEQFDDLTILGLHRK